MPFDKAGQPGRELRPQAEKRANARRARRTRHRFPSAEGLEPRSLLAVAATGIADIQSLPSLGNPASTPSVDAFAMDKDGFTYLAGTYSNNLSISPLLPVTVGDRYVTKIDQNGQALWVVNIGGGGRSFNSETSNSTLTIKDIAVDATGSVHIVGSALLTAIGNGTEVRIDPPVSAQSRIDLPTIINNRGDNQRRIGIIIKLDNQGDFQSHMTIDSSLSVNPDRTYVTGRGASVDSVSTDGMGNVYYSGVSTHGSKDHLLRIAKTTLSFNSTTGFFVAKAGPDGKIQNSEWVAKLPNGATSSVIESDAAGDLLVVGNASGEITIGNETLTPSPQQSFVFLAKMSKTDGSILSARKVVSGTSIRASGLAIDAANNLYLAGTYSQSELVSSSPTVTNLANPGMMADVFVTKIDAGGNPAWLQGFQGTGSDSVATIATNGQNQLFLAGSFEGTIQIGRAKFKSAGSSDLYLAQVDTEGRVVAALRGGGSGPDAMGGIATLPSGRVVVAASISQSTTNPSLFGGGLAYGPRAAVATLQISRPTAGITPLPPEVHELAIPVAWGDTSSADATTFDVYVTVDGGPRQLWRPQTAERGASYYGDEGHRYAFSVVAYDANGISSPPGAEVATTVRTRAVAGIAVRANADRVQEGQALVVTATVTSPDSAWASVPTGAVLFFVNGTQMGDSVPLDGGGMASALIAALGVGEHQVTAVYIGTGRFLGGEFGSIAVTVDRSINVNKPDPSETDPGKTDPGETVPGKTDPVPTVSVQRAATLKKKGKFQGIQVSFGGTLDEASAEVAANYVLQMTVKAKGKKGKTRLVSIPIRSATYAGGQVTLQPAKKLKPGKYQIQVLSTPLGGLRDTAGAMLINGGATFSLKV